MEVKNHPEINAHYVNETVQHFLQARGIVNHLCPAIDHGGGWCRCDILNQTTPRMESNWVETGFHAFPLECLASIIQNGLLESSPDRSGCRFSEGPGLYLTRQRTYSAQSYSRFVANRALVFCRFTMECLVDRNQRLLCSGSMCKCLGGARDVPVMRLRCTSNCLRGALLGQVRIGKLRASGG